jgi:hypothetical protein
MYFLASTKRSPSFIYKNFDDDEDWPPGVLVVDPPVDDPSGGDMENIRKILKKLEEVPRVINSLNENQLRELIASMCNPRQVELPNLVTHYIAVKEYVHSCLT